MTYIWINCSEFHQDKWPFKPCMVYSSGSQHFKFLIQFLNAASWHLFVHHKKINNEPTLP